MLLNVCAPQILSYQKVNQCQGRIAIVPPLSKNCSGQNGSQQEKKRVGITSLYINILPNFAEKWLQVFYIFIPIYPYLFMQMNIHPLCNSSQKSQILASTLNNVSSTSKRRNPIKSPL